MNTTIYIAMYGLPALALVLFASLPVQRAILIVLFGGWLLLPQAQISFSGLPDYTRTVAVMFSIGLGVMLFDSGRLTKFKFQKYDLPIIIFCLCPLMSSLSNGLGLYDGLSGVFTFALDYGVPYFIGRLYFSDTENIRVLSIGLVVAVFCYTPLILWEWRMSPQLHKHIYGFMQIPFHMIWRMGWYRPMVFLRHGIELGALVASAAITAFWLWRCGTLKKISIFPAALVALTLLGISLICRAMNGYVILAIGICSLYLMKKVRMRLIIILLVLMPQAYVYGRVVTNWDAASLIEITKEVYPERAFSLQSRISHEVTLIDKALEHSVFGWGGYDRNRADELAIGARGKKSITDSWWIIIFGQRGLVGLLSLGFVLLRPISLLSKKISPMDWSDERYAPVAALAMVLLGFTVDCLVNAMVSPIYFVIAGALIAYTPEPDKGTEPEDPIKQFKPSDSFP